MTATSAKPLRRPLLEDEQLFYIHIPKSAGTTFIGIVDTRYLINEICPVHWPYRDVLKEPVVSNLASYKFIRGHFPYSLVNHLPERPVCITFFRDPVERMISEFEQAQRTPLASLGLHFATDPTPVREIYMRLQSMSLSEFMQHDEIVDRFTNRAAKYFGGEPEDETIVPHRVPNMALARERIAGLEFIGVREHFDESLELFAYTFGFPPISRYETKNVTPHRDRRSSIPQDVLEQVTELNQLDIELYQYGLRLFRERHAQMLEATSRQANRAIFIRDTPPRRSIRFDFHRMDPGQGWQVGEEHPVYGPYRWTGPDTVSSLYFNLAPGHDLIIRFRIINAISTDVVASLRLTVNGSEVELNRFDEDVESGKATFEGCIPASVLENTPAASHLMFTVSETMSPRDIDSENEDKRLLGLAFSWLHIYPA